MRSGLSVTSLAHAAKSLATMDAFRIVP